MAQRIRVPRLVDLVLVADPSEIRALNDEPRLDRRFLPRGPLVNRLIAGRIRRWFQIKGQPLPSLAARGDQVRAKASRNSRSRSIPPAVERCGTNNNSISSHPSCAALAPTMALRLRSRRLPAGCLIPFMRPIRELEGRDPY